MLSKLRIRFCWGDNRYRVTVFDAQAESIVRQGALLGSGSGGRLSVGVTPSQVLFDNSRVRHPVSVLPFGSQLLIEIR